MRASKPGVSSAFEMLTSRLRSSAVLHPFLVKQGFVGADGWGKFLRWNEGYCHPVLVFARRIVDVEGSANISDVAAEAYSEVMKHQDFLLAALFREVFIENAGHKIVEDVVIDEIDRIIRSRSFVAYHCSGGPAEQDFKVRLYLSAMGHFPSVLMLLYLSLTVARSNPFLVILFPVVLGAILSCMVSALVQPTWIIYWKYYDLSGVLPASVVRLDRQVQSGRLDIADSL